MKRNAAFSLVELLVVIAIISVLAALLLPSLERSLSMARVSACLNNERQIHQACYFYAENHNGSLMTPHLRNGRACLSRMNDIVDSSVAAVYPNSSMGRKVYCGQGLLWSQGYCADLGVFMETEWTNESTPNCLIYQGRPQRALLEPKTPDSVNGGYLSPSWGTASCYAVFDQDLNNPIIYGGALTKPRKLGKTPKYGVTALVMCSMARLADDNLSAHNKENLNIVYEDGHGRTVADARTWMESLASGASYYSPYGMGTWEAWANYSTTWWAFARDIDKR